MAFIVISITPDLDAKCHQRAGDNGPKYITVASEYPPLLQQAGWRIEHRIDVTAAYEDTTGSYVRAWETHKERLVDVVGHDYLAGRLHGYRAKLAAIEDRLLMRELYVVRPASP